MEKLLKPYADEVIEDKLGNVIAIKKGKKDSPKVMLAAHMDEIGLLVKNISKDGFIQFAKVGGIDDRILPAQRVILCTEKGPLKGIIGVKPPHIQKEEERKKVIGADEMFIDVGAGSLDEAKKMGVRVGDPIGFDVKFVKLGKDIVIGKALDDRVGCAMLIEALSRLGKTDCTIYAVGTVQEEVGLRGAITSAFGICPDVGLALDVTVSGDTPEIREIDAPVKMKKGPSLTVSDAGMIVPRKILKLLTETAEEKKIPYQLETGLAGTTDAARILLTRDGVPSGVISVPTRYIHNPASMASLNDVENAVELLVAVIQNIPKKI